jgi:raffinose/stachyose/melibiose transport system substrate-binding protein
MKRAIRIASILTTAALMTATLAACGGSGDGGDSGSGEGKLAKISLFQSKVEIAGPLEALAKKYTEETGNEVDVWGSAGDNYISQLQAKLNAGEGPTIFSVQPGAEAQKYASYYVDLSNEDYVKNIAPGLSTEIDGKTVGVPIGVEGFGLVYNKDLVRPDEVTDLESFTSVLQKFKGEGKTGISLSQEAYFLIGHIINTPFSVQDDPKGFVEKVNSGEVKMADTPAFQEFARFMETIRENAVNPLEVTYDSQMGDLAAGKSAMVHQGNWSFGMLSEFGDLNVSMMPLPLGGNDKLAVDLPAMWVINNKATEAQIEAAHAFIDWVFNSETGKNTIVNEFKFIPSMTNIEAPNLDPLSQAVFEATQSGNTIPWALNYFPQGIIINDLAPITQEFFLNGGITGEQYLQKLDEAWAKAPK